ncbi:hypothetical protein MLD38_006153 [Melastoma candidum]|uniref:Uncharacterized protein n=1 Tax=Melastoma candidum TaxID=119954 RepID=A0ACB9RNX6_9MYRT|nr:hypothetical protein MLD38_006153 [Melastoma candidum]
MLLIPIALHQQSMEPVLALTEAADIPQPEADSHLLSLVYEMSQQVQTVMENMLKMISEIEQNSTGINEDLEKCRESALERKKGLEEQKDRFQKAAFAVIDMLNPE